MARTIIVMLLFWLTVPAIAGSQNWERLGPEGGLVVSMAACADGTGHLDTYLGTPDGHIFARSASDGDGKEKWQLRGRVAARTDAVVARLLCDPAETKVLYAAVWFQEAGAGGGVFRSVDEGRSWAPLGLAGEAVRALEQAPSNPQILVAGTRTGVFRSQDGGESWQRISPAGDQELRNLDSIAIDPQDPELIYAGTYHLPWKTGDGGKTWKSIGSGLIDDSDIMSLRIDAANSKKIYLSACSGIYRSENRGELWFKLPGIPYAARRTQAIVQDPYHPETLYAATTEGLWLSRNAGESWKRATPADWVVNAVLIELKGAGASRVLLGTEAQGVMSSGDLAESWNPDNASFRHTVVRELISDPRDSRHLLMIVQRSGAELLESRDAGVHWTPASLTLKPLHGSPFNLNTGEIQRIYGGPAGWFVKLGQQPWFWNEATANWNLIPLRFATPMQNMPAQKKTPRGARRAPVSQGENGKVAWNSDLIEFAEKDFFLATRGGILRCSLSGSCAALKAFALVKKNHAPAQKVSALGVSRDGQSILAVVSGKLGVSQDGGATAVWDDLPSDSGEALFLDAPQNGATPLFLATTTGLWRSTDDGEHWMVCRGGLPAAPVGHFLRGDKYLFVALREGGLYGSRDQGVTWQRLEQDAERGNFTALREISPGMLLLASQSEGLLRWTASPTE